MAWIGVGAGGICDDWLIGWLISLQNHRQFTAYFDSIKFCVLLFVFCRDEQVGLPSQLLILEVRPLGSKCYALWSQCLTPSGTKTKIWCWIFWCPQFQGVLVLHEWCHIAFSPPARWGLLDFMSVACSSPPLLSSSCSTATLDAQCSLSDLNHDHPRPVFPAGPQPRPSPPSVPCRTSTTTIHAQCSLPDLNREYPRQVFPAGPHVGRYGTKNVQKKVRKNVRQVCYILLANSRVCGRVTGAMPLLTLQVAKFEAISLNRWQSHWGGQRHFHFCTFGAVCKDAWDRQHLTASYYKLLEVISCWIDAWDSQHHTGFLLCITAMVAWWICKSPVTKASDKSGVNKLFWNVMVGITRSKVIFVFKWILREIRCVSVVGYCNLKIVKSFESKDNSACYPFGPLGNRQCTVLLRHGE